MKRLMDRDDNSDELNLKKVKIEKGKSPIIEEEEEEVGEIERGFNKLDENLLYEVLKHADARTLAVSACVNKLWHNTAQDERLWELICTRHWVNIGCGTQQLRSVVLALGGFRRLHSQCLRPLSKPSTASGADSPRPRPATQFSTSQRTKSNMRWGKDEVNLSLSLLSIRYYEKMNYSNRGK